jgi:antitoxin (DNA-binding transcriptional repressor) of toxin-antitoxin stability system
MQNTINAKDLRDGLGDVLNRVRKGERFTVLYRSQPVCQLVPLADIAVETDDFKGDSLFRAEPIGYSSDDRIAAEHDDLLYDNSHR